MSSNNHNNTLSGDDRADNNDVKFKTTKKFFRFAETILKITALFALLYLFICSLDFLSSAFRLIGSQATGRVISNSDLLKNPIVGLMIGVLITVVIQSSSTTTSIIVTMVGSDLLTVRNAIPLVMGANIGTSVTNTIVSLMQSSDRNEFRHAFAAATVHDMFNWLTVIVLLPVEIAFHYLENLTNALINLFEWKQETVTNIELLNKLTKPFTKMIIELDKKALTNDSIRMVKKCCSYSKNSSVCLKKCTSLINQMQMSDKLTGFILLISSIIILCGCLIVMVKSQIASVIKKTINTDSKSHWSIVIDYLSILIGCFITILVQSSSVFTSALTPLAGIEVISLERVYQLTLGSNIGTTTTGILAALAADSRSLRNSLQLAFCHLFFNITGILIFYPLPFMRIPLTFARVLGNVTAEYRWFSILYLLMMFFSVPLMVFGLSLAGNLVLIGVGGPILLTIVLIVIVNVIQHKKPSILPKLLRNWNFLPLWMHSLEPMDNLIQRLACLTCRNQGYEVGNNLAINMQMHIPKSDSQPKLVKSNVVSLF